MGIKSILKTGTLLVCTFGLSTTVIADADGANIITVKGGTFSMSEPVQSIFFDTSSTTTFEEDPSTFGVEYDRMMNDNVSIGGGAQIFNTAYRTFSGSTGEMDATFITFNSKYHFTTGNFKPFIGGTAGFVVTDFTSDSAFNGLSGNTAGLTLGLMAGFRWQFSTVGIYAEYKNYLTANTEDSADAEVDLAGDSITGGVSIAF
ncbi:hypothetical protein MNBD_GAMMA21-1226 [hydrothermal vent metagenome]|uniref:Outer membrane protein beta-barrel domain-containing protein n=1 Tax=hydrothermal vent metagenome TaxID=652676 RepID=A0A3B0ZSY0_9ZZZZ